MWMLAIAAALAVILAVVVLVRRRRRMPPSFLDIWEPLDGRANPEPTPTRPCDHCKHIVSMWEFNGPPVHSNPSPEGLAMAREWAENLKRSTFDTSKRAHRACRRHHDCDSADSAYRANNDGRTPTAAFHSHDPSDDYPEPSAS